ncbi:cytochrome P450 [Nocardia terpenica]|nr:cytochrome P450 [Nocardia terpenica]
MGRACVHPDCRTHRRLAVRISNRVPARAVVGPRPASGVTKVSERTSSIKPASSATRLPGALPLLGHMLRFRNHLDLLTSMPAHGELVELRVGPARILMACTAELAHELLSNGERFDKGGQFFDRAKEVVGNSLTTCSHNEHRRQRRLVQPAFHRARMPGYATQMSMEIATTFGAWRHGDTVDITAETNTLVAKILARTVFPHSVSPSALGRIIDDIDTLVAVAARRMVVPPALHRIPTPGNRRYEAANRRLRDLMVRTANTADRSANSDHGDDLLSILLSTRDIGECLTHTEIVDQLLLFQVAGIDTTATALAWALYLVATHPEVEQRLHAEVDDTLAGSHVATHKHLPGLQYTRQIVNETLRRYPPVWFLTRTAMTDTQLGTYVIPAGTTLAVSPYLLHHRPDLYPSPFRFDPDRWGSGKPPAGVYIPFGYGARRCIGEHFALTELILALASVAARWRLRLARADHRPRPRLAASLRPPQLPMTVSRRTPD